MSNKINELPHSYFVNECPGGTSEGNMTSTSQTNARVDRSSKLSGARILHVDPDEDAGQQVVTTLGEASVQLVSSGGDALSALDEKSVDCLVSEYTLPDMDGLDLLEAVRDDGVSVPFILYTDAGSEDLASAAITAGVTEYVKKTRSDALSELERRIEDIVREQGRVEISANKADEFQTLVEDIRDQAIFLLDREGHVASWNRGAENIKGYTEDEILGQHFSTFYTEDDVEQGIPEECLAQAREEGRVEIEGWRVRKDGSRFWASVVITALRDVQGDVRGFVKFTRNLTEQRRREEQLRREHGLTKRLLTTVPTGIIIHDADGNLLRANARAEEILDISKMGLEPKAESEYGLTLYNIDGTPLDDGTHPVKQVFSTGEPVFNREIVIERSDGSYVCVSVNSVPLFDENDDIERVITAGQDITALKEQEQQLYETKLELEQTVDELQETNRELLQTENRFEALTENSSFTVISIDGTSTVQYANETVEDIFGYEPDELVGEPVTKLMPEGMRPKHREAVEHYLETGDRHLDWGWLELPGRHKSGLEIQLGLSFGDTVVNGDHLFTGVIRDITEQKERQRELERRREELTELVDELERSNAELEEFAYVVSHDLKEPLRMVTSYLELLERRYQDNLDEDANEFIEFAIDGADRMRRMIDDLLAYSRVGRNEVDREPVDCGAIVDDVLASLPDTENVTVTTENLPTVAGTRTHLIKLFQNLISNAIKYNDSESVTIQISATRRDGWWRIAVADNGPGIPPAYQDTIFNLFTSVGTDGGTGVGLSICRKVVEQHGGSIWVESEPGEGTTFFFTLPDADSSESTSSE